MLKNIPFTKMEGCGNDFIIIDNRSNILKEEEKGKFAKQVCQRKFSVGADGLMLVEQSGDFDFKFRLFNSDGSEPEMCGNGARCLAKYSYEKGIVKAKMVFETLAGPIKAEIFDNEVGIKFPDINADDITSNKQIQVDNTCYDYNYVFMGVPHVIIYTNNTNKEELFQIGKQIRYNKKFFPNGTNVNFIQINQDNSLAITTYERGTEQLCLACGTGSTAAAVISCHTKNIHSPVKVHNIGGLLTIQFDYGNNIYSNITLIGNANIKAEGIIF